MLPLVVLSRPAEYNPDLIHMYAVPSIPSASRWANTGRVLFQFFRETSGRPPGTVLAFFYDIFLNVFDNVIE